ncbi:MAG: hypothetical protein D6706_16060, partial [Chloroflexi bacterium]
MAQANVHVLPLVGVGVAGDGVGAAARPVAAKGEVTGLLHRAIALPDDADAAQVVGVEVEEAVVGLYLAPIHQHRHRLADDAELVAFSCSKRTKLTHHCLEWMMPYNIVA